VELDMTKTQLAAFLGTIPETLSRVFAKMSQDGLIAIDGYRIQLLNRRRLTVLAEG
jgi:CRP/FNR family transcriptional regulator